MQTLGQSFIPTPYPWREAQSQMNLTGVRQGSRARAYSTSGKARTWDSEILRAVLNSGLGHMDGAPAGARVRGSLQQDLGSPTSCCCLLGVDKWSTSLSFLFLRHNHFSEVTGGC